MTVAPSLLVDLFLASNAITARVDAQRLELLQLFLQLRLLVSHSEIHPRILPGHATVQRVLCTFTPLSLHDEHHVSALCHHAEREARDVEDEEQRNEENTVVQSPT